MALCQVDLGGRGGKGLADASYDERVREGDSSNLR